MTLDPNYENPEFWLCQITLTGGERPSNITVLLRMDDGLSASKHLVFYVKAGGSEKHGWIKYFSVKIGDILHFLHRVI